MSKLTLGERIWQRVQDSAFSGLHQPYGPKEIDALVRREKAKAWDECYVRICESDLCIAADLKVPRDANPYRGRVGR